MKKLFLFTLAATLLTACSQPDPNKQVDGGTLNGDTYHCPEVGWTISIPADWKITTKDKMEELDKAGKSAITADQKVELDTVNKMKYLVSFQKNQFNLFLATSQPFKGTDAEYALQTQITNKAIYETCTHQGVKIDTSTGKEIIQGMEFSVFCDTIFSPDGNVILKQILYNRLINGYDLAIDINYTNDADKKTMLDAFKNCKFDKNYPIR
ncbi:MAG TPA: hypothetical protein VK890_01320 [Bacteroidia bacterium]|jgi:hypothetical protein|nr:hypothetical protein [Bacteroidia bacterium]